MFTGTLKALALSVEYENSEILTAEFSIGGAVVGETLHIITAGDWSGIITGMTYQVRRDGANINGATVSSYQTVEDDADTEISIIETATGPGGSVSVSSNAIAVFPVA